jgi:4-hydroxy-tetrahydrodipicolinate synthase
MAQMRGVYSIPVTPFEENGAVDYDSLRRCVAFCVEAGAHGIVLPVNASEGPFLTDDERRAVVSVGVKAADKALPFVAGVTGLTVQHAVENTAAAVEAGADSVIAAPPNGASGDYLFDYYGAVAEAAGVPVWIQNNKPPTSPTIPTPMIVKILKEIEHADYVKEESLVPGQVMTELFASAGKACKGIMGGMGGRFLIDEYHRGGCGTMPAGHITDVHRKLWDALEKGGKSSDGLQAVTDEARGIWEQMLPALNFEFMFSIAAYKMAFYRRGVIKTPFTRNPAAKPLDRLDIEELDTILDRLSPLFRHGKVKV